MKVKTSELTGAALDWAVAKALGVYTPSVDTDTFDGVKRINYGGMYPEWSTDWAGGGPVIEREKISLIEEADRTWQGSVGGATDLEAPFWFENGPTPLIAAMRCYVASELGDEVEIPEELA
jgi:hypothetical protein